MAHSQSLRFTYYRHPVNSFPSTEIFYLVHVRAVSTPNHVPVTINSPSPPPSNLSNPFLLITSSPSTTLVTRKLCPDHQPFLINVRQTLLSPSGAVLNQQVLLNALSQKTIKPSPWRLFTHEPPAPKDKQDAHPPPRSPLVAAGSIVWGRVSRLQTWPPRPNHLFSQPQNPPVTYPPAREHGK